MKTAPNNNPSITIWGLLKLLFWLSLLIPLRALATATQPQTTYKGPNSNCEPVLAIPPECPEFELVQYTRDTSFFNTVILGEKHKHRSTTAACVERLTAAHPKHNIYLEGVEADRKVPCADFRIANKAGRTCIGWDNMAESDKTMQSDMMQVYALKKIQEEQKTHGLSDKDFDTYLQNYQKEVEKKINSYDQQQSTAKQKEQITGQKVLLSTIKLVLQERKQSKNSYTSIINSRFLAAAKELQNPDTGKAQATAKKKSCRVRNESLIKTLANNPLDRFAVVIAGVHHVKAASFPANADIQDACDAEYVQQELRRGENGNPYAILAMVK